MTATRYVLGVDPGTNTGVVTWDNVNHSVRSRFTATNPRVAVEQLNSTVQHMVHTGNHPTLLIERLDLSQDTLRKSREGLNDLIHVLGATWAIATFFDLEYHELGRSDTKNFAHDDALKLRGMWLETRHTRDAIRVVFTWLATHDKDFVKNFWAVS